MTTSGVRFPVSFAKSKLEGVIVLILLVLTSARAQSPTREYVRLGSRLLAIEACSVFSLTPVSRSFTLAGGSTSVGVAAGAGCGWTATTDSASWITLTSPNGAGNGTFGFTVAANASRARLGKVSAENASFKVMQGGVSTVVPFQDVQPSSPYFDYVSLMQSFNITAGCSVTPPLYCPDTAVTRGQMAVFIVAALDIAMGTTGTWQPNPTPYFDDVQPSHPFFRFVQRIRDLGITAGCSITPPLYCPDNPIPQKQMAVFIVASWMRANNLSGFTSPSTPYFTDVTVDGFFRFIQKMREMRFWLGCPVTSPNPTTYCPDTAVTRGDMSMMIMRGILGAP